MNRRLALQQLTALAGAAYFAPQVFAQASEELFSTLASPVATPGDGRVEVIEFFSYGCPHCRNLNPLVQVWQKTLPDDVNLVHVPVTFNRDQWTAYARVYYVLEALGLLDEFHTRVFTAIHDGRVRLDVESRMLDWFVAEGQDRATVERTFKSFGVNARLQRANQLANEYRVNGVPMFAIDGRYVVSAGQVGSFEKMLEVAEQLIAKGRARLKQA